MAESIFTKIINREIPAHIEYEDEDIIAFKDISPAAAVHILIVPKKHIATLNDAEDGDEVLLGKIILTAAKIAKQKGIAENGYRLIMNCNKDGGQTVFHIHCHLLGGENLGGLLH